jgi:membrane protease YdiL (CAAX protease family)
METIQFLKIFGSQLIFLTVVGAIVMVLSLLMRLKVKIPCLDNPRRRAIVALLSVGIGMTLSSMILFTSHNRDTNSAKSPVSGSGVTAPIKSDSESTADLNTPLQIKRDSPKYDSSDSQQLSQKKDNNGGPAAVLEQLMLFIIALLPIIIAMYLQRESLSSACITSHNLAGSVVIGLALGLLSMLVAMAGKMFIVNWNIGHLWAFLQFTIVGFGEEFTFRGYLQTRLICWLGKYTGWIVASVFMALIHFGYRLVMMGMDPAQALISCLGLIPISLFMGFVMLRTGNILAPGIMHIFANWVNAL